MKGVEGGPALVLVATPIGNMGDLAPRAVEELAAAAVIACEDSRRTGRLLSLAGITGKELVVVNEHTEADAAPLLVARIVAGERVVLVTDAGTPAVADPGERLVRAAAEAGCTVSIVPGPSAPLAAVAVSGLTSGRFVYEGFLPRRGAARAERLAELAASARARGAARGAPPLRPHRGRPGGGVRVAAARRGGARAHQAARGDLAGKPRRVGRLGRARGSAARSSW